MQETLAESPPGSPAKRVPVEAGCEAVAGASAYQPARAWMITGWLSLFAVINFLDKVVLGMVAVPLMHDFQLTHAEFGLIAGSFFWLFSVSGAVVGFLGNRVQARWLLLAMALLWSAVQLPVAFAASVTTLLVARVILGAGEGPAFPVSVHALYKWFPHEKRNLPVSVINQGATVGLLLAGLLVPYVTAHWGWRMNFLVLGAASMVWAAGWLLCGREGNVATHAGAAAASGKTVPYRRLLTDPTVLCGIVTGFAAYWGLALTLTWIPAYLQQGLGFDAATAGRLFALIVACGIPVSLALSWLSQRLLRAGVSTRVARVIFACLCVGLGGVLSLLLPILTLPPLAKVALLAVGGMFPPIAFALQPAVVGEVVPDRQRSGVLALVMSLVTSAGAVAPVVMGRLIQSAATPVQGYEKGFAVCGLIMIAGCVIGILGQNPERSKRRLNA